MANRIQRMFLSGSLAAMIKKVQKAILATPRYVKKYGMAIDPVA